MDNTLLKNVRTDLPPSDILESSCETLHNTAFKTKGFYIFFSFKNGEITKEECAVHMALLTTESITQYAPQIFPTMDPSIISYCGSRVSGKIKRERALAVRNGSWIYSVHRCLEFNKKNIELLSEDVEVLSSKGMSEKAQTVNKVLQRNIVVMENFPKGIYANAIDTQAMDSFDRPIFVKDKRKEDD